MSLPWRRRKTRLSVLLSSRGDEDADGTAIDRLMHGQSVIGKTSKTAEIDALRFQDKDLDLVGTLEYGQFGVIDVVTCHLNNCVYVRKSIEKKFALRTRDQCSPQIERNILVQAAKTNSPWVPHLLASYQMTTHLNLVMDYAEGGTLWDVLESSHHDGKILEADLRWWAPQIISAIHWCHGQGYAHRDIKPHNFVITQNAHIFLIDFGSAAPLLPPGSDGTQRLPRQYCLVPCGTCDYISPEILKAHEEALVALEMEDEEDDAPILRGQEIEGYGVETDWWSLGAMLYEMAYGVAPFFANEIRRTYQRIMNHEKSLRFDQKSDVSPELQNLLKQLLTTAETRLGRRNIMEITDHTFFEGIQWSTLPTQSAPSTLHLPQFTYSEAKAVETANPVPDPHYDESMSQGFAFSAFFQSSKAMTSPALSILHSKTPNSRSSIKEDPNSSFIGFSWGPTINAFPDDISNDGPPIDIHATPLPLKSDSLNPTPIFHYHNRLNSGYGNTLSTPDPRRDLYTTPNRPYAESPYQTLPRTSTIRRTAPRRNVSDREAMKQLVDCVGMSARKKVLESGRKPRILTSFSLGRSTGNTLRKELRFYPTTTPIPLPDYHASSPKPRLAPLVVDYGAYSGSEGTDSEGPPSPSPTPRPGSAMSMMSRRSGTPTITTTGTFSSRFRSNSNGSTTGFLSIPSSFLVGGSNLPPSRAGVFGNEERGKAASMTEPQSEFSEDPDALDAWGELEERHAAIMRNIDDLEQRLVHVCVLVEK